MSAAPECRVTPATAVITITSPDADGTQHFALNGKHLYSLWVIDSIRGTRYAVRPHGHIGRTFIGADRSEAFMHAVDFTFATTRTEERRETELSQPAPWPGFTPHCSYACRRGCDH